MHYADNQQGLVCVCGGGGFGRHWKVEREDDEYVEARGPS